MTGVHLLRNENNAELSKILLFWLKQPSVIKSHYDFLFDGCSRQVLLQS